MAVHEMFRSIQGAVAKTFHSESPTGDFYADLATLRELKNHPAHAALTYPECKFSYYQDPKTKERTVTLTVSRGVAYEPPKDIQGFKCTDIQELPDGAHAYVFTVTR